MKNINLKKLYTTGDVVLTVLWILLFVFSLAGVINIKTAPYNIIDTLILVLFTISYIVRFVRAKDKKTFFKENIFDLLAIIPLQLFNVGILARSNRIFRIINLLGKLGHQKNTLLYRNGFVYALYASACIVFVGSGFFSIFETISYQDSIWWSIVTMTTVGYGDIIPATTGGRVVASITMIFGIGFISMLTSTLTNYIKPSTTDDKKKQADEDEIQQLHQKIDKLTKTIETLTEKIDENKKD